MPCCKTNDVNSKDNYIRPIYRKKALTEKFYARHESFDCDPKVLNSPNVIRYMKWISKERASTLQTRQLVPITENQTYGWLIHLVDAPDEMDRDITYYSRKNDSQLKIMGIIEAEIKRTRGYWYR
uniref:Inosine-5'-monophosphate dehydrogenase n=1 Tax=Zeugodacus cucurbitae TaxID=28588 RepID=A0A0A1X284_ZEUCU